MAAISTNIKKPSKHTNMDIDISYRKTFYCSRLNFPQDPQADHEEDQGSREAVLPQDRDHLHQEEDVE